jgi:lysophospholipase L1-like esterase
LNTGISGNTLLDLERRWQRDVIDLKPDWLSVMIGINDVWQQVGIPFLFPNLNKKSYEKTFRKLIQSVANNVRGIILMTPYYLELNKRDPMRKLMDEYGDIVKKLSTEFSTMCVDTQAAFDLYMENHPEDSLSLDKVHPNLTGYQIIAESFIKVIV